jgi:hypothetical protein
MITKENFMERFEKASDFKRPVDEAAIEKHLLKWFGGISTHTVKVSFLRNAQALRENRKDARDAWDARDRRVARDARDAWDVRDTRVARDASVAWVARDAWVARVARDAWAARDAWVTWVARDARVTRDARDAWDPWVARDARDAWVAWVAKDARVARDAWVTRDARDACWDLSYMNCAIAGAIALKDTAFYDKWIHLFYALEAGAWLIWFTADTIFVATLPTIKRAAPQRLHCVDGPAFAWCDMELYYLNGVLMEPWMVMTHPSEIEAKKVLAVTNVDQRRELIRRIGIEALVDHLPHKSLDKQGDYELLAIDLSPDLLACRYLKMLNPSIKVWHLEGVSNDCQTVQHAINWRAFKDINKQWSPCQLT